MKNRSETFGRLLKAGIGSIAMCEGKKAPIIEDELGQQIGVSGDTIQRYKAGSLPPEARSVQIMAEACVQRGYLNREWLQRFLHAARYPFAEKLLHQLCPNGPALPRPPRVYENLPAPTYSQFVMREQAFADVLDGLQQRSAVVLIMGMGGNGKTSLAHEVASACLRADGAAPRFDAVVWVSDKDRPGTTNLSTVLDEVARTLDYPGFTQFEHEEKRREVEQLLRRQRVLLVIDNFETITDRALLSWLLRLPEPSKALITSRERHRGLWSSWLIELRGMSETEAQTLIRQRLRVLQLDKVASCEADFEPLVTVTSGNPKATEIALGLVKYERRALQHVVDDLYAAQGDLFTDLFARAWSLLDEAARRVLLAMTFFPTSANGEALRTTADVQGYSFDRVIERLTDLALLDVRQIDLATTPRYALHPLMRAFSVLKLATQSAFEKEARDRWLKWYISFTAQVGYCFDDLEKLTILETEQETIFSVIEWSFQMRLFQDTYQVSINSIYYYFVRGYWDKVSFINRCCVESAHALGNLNNEVLYLAYSSQILLRRHILSETEQNIIQLQSWLKHTDLSEEVMYEIRNTLSLYWQSRNDIQKIHGMWQTMNTRDPKIQVGIQNWLAIYEYEQGNLQEARTRFNEATNIALHYPDSRGFTALQIRLTRIDLDEEKINDARERLVIIHSRAYKYQDRRYMALIQRLYGRLHTLSGDFTNARMSLIEAIDLFERLGMRREHAEARQALADLETSETPAT